jgi:uncharacterized protein YqgV (UPF0045/DUF77 family)
MFPLYTTVLFAFKRLLSVIRRKKERSLNIDAQEPRRYRIIKVQNLRKKTKECQEKTKEFQEKNGICWKTQQNLRSLTLF